VRSVALLAAALACGVASQGLIRPRAMAARRCWPRDNDVNLGWKHAAPLLGRELTADILWARTLVYYGDARFRQAGTVPEELPLACAPRPGKIDAAVARGLALPAETPATPPPPDPLCASCGFDWDRPDFGYLQPLLDAVVAADPGFKPVYRWAAFAVTYKEARPTQDEFLVSLRYLRAAMVRFPDDPEYFWLAGTRYFIDLDQSQASARHCAADIDALDLRGRVEPDSPHVCRDIGVELIERAMRKPSAPRSYAELAAAFNTKLGRQQRAVHDLEETVLTVDSADARAGLIEKLRQYQASDLADELERVTADIEARRRATLPYAPPALYFILGDRPSKVIDFDQLATERDLFGADQDDP